MLKKFFLNLLSSFIGAWLAIFLGLAAIVLIIFAVLGKLAISENVSQQVKVSDHSVLVLNLDGRIQETEMARDLDLDMLIQGKIEKPQTLLSLITALNEAASDPRIEAVYVKCGVFAAAPATAHALQEALANYKKKTKKPVIAYADNLLTQGTLYISSCADSIFLNPQGKLAMMGCGNIGLYMKEFFDKIGIQWQVARVGTYKSAIEPFTTNEMSEPARRQLLEVFNAVWNELRSGIAKGRKISATEIDSMTNDMVTFWDAGKVLKTGIISGLAYERQMDKKIASIINVSDPDDINFIEANSFGAQNAMPPVKGEHVAVLYATGEIAENSQSGIDCYKLVPEIVELAEDEDVKALVLRVNSPGGSVFGSEQISEALNYFRSTGKPLIVSMGDYAASGGYWISCEANRIFADPLTLTGSIGIFGLVPNGKELLNKVGLTSQTVATNPDAMIGTPLQPLTDKQMAALQKAIDAGYQQFITKVAKGRKMTVAAVDSIAQGRVWTGIAAKKLGLVDELGSLQKAIEYASKKAGLKETEIGYYPILKPSFWDMIPADSELYSLLKPALQNTLGQQATPYLLHHISNILQRKHEQAVMPAAWYIRI